jgi:hypothetical protein
VIDVQRIALNGDDQPDRWLMQTVLKHRSSDAARAAAVWLGAYDAALSFGFAAPHAQVPADIAYRATGALAGLPMGDGTQG